MDLKGYISSYPGFPKEGIIFRDICPLLQDPDAFNQAVNEISESIARSGANVIVAPEARGFIFGTPVAYKLSLPFVPIRKPGKLPGNVIEMEYDLEYGSNTLVVPADSIHPGDKVAIVDDLVATGGTLQAITKLVEKMGGEVVNICCVIELPDLKGREVLSKYDVSSLLTFEGE